MDTGEIVTLTAILVGLAAILVGIFALMWQMHSQGSRLDAKIDAQSADMKAQGAKLNDVEREQARLEGVNSVLRIHSHTHEADD